MFKKMLVTTAILAAASSAYAAAPYVGGSIGVLDTLYNVKETASGSTFNTGGRNPNFTIFGGYGAVVNQNIYLGGEVFANTATGTLDGASTDDASVKYETRYTYGASFIPGFMLTDHTMVYGRLGVVRASFNVNASVPGETSNTNDSVTGGQAGLGVQTNLMQNLDLRGEYVYSDYNSFTESGVKTSPTSDQFNVGLVYKFD